MVLRALLGEGDPALTASPALDHGQAERAGSDRGATGGQRPGKEPETRQYRRDVEREIDTCLECCGCYPACAS